MNEDGIEDFYSVWFLLRQFSIGQNVTFENYIKNFARV